MDIKYPLAKQTITNEEIDQLRDWLGTYPRLTMGDMTKEFEKQWAQFIGTKYAVFVNSGSSANLLMIATAIEKCRQHERNKKIVVPSVGWVTTIAPTIQLGLKPIMVDADPFTFGINLHELEEICKKEKPQYVIFVQVLGVPHYKKKLLELAATYNFVLLEDGCAALGAKYEDNTKVGTVGHMSSFSFYFGHQLSTIEGGMVNTDDFETYQTMLMLRSHGWGKDLDPRVYDTFMEEEKIDKFHQPFTFFLPGYNLRSTDLQAFLGINQMKKADWVVQRRYENHILYAKELERVFNFQRWGKDYPVSISFGALAKDSTHRKSIITNLVNNGIETRLFSAGNLGKHPFWKNLYGEFSAPMADRIHSTGFFLPNYPTLSETDIVFICDIVKKS